MKQMAELIAKSQAEKESLLLGNLLKDSAKSAPAKAPAKKRSKKGADSASEAEADSDSDDNDDEEEEPKEKMEIKDFRWETSARKFGYFNVVFEDSKPEVTKMNVKPVLMDYADQGIFFIYDKYMRDSPTVKFIEKEAKGFHQIDRASKKQKVIPGFTSIISYAMKKQWQPSNDLASKRLQFGPAYDALVEPTVKNSKKTKGKSRATTVVQVMVTNNAPDDVATNNAPDDVATNYDPDDVATNNAPDDMATNNAPDDVATNNAPDDVVTNNAPENLDTHNALENVDTNNATDVATNNASKEVDTNNATKDVATNNATKDVTTTTPIRKAKKRTYCEEIQSPIHPCQYPNNHHWEEIISGDWVVRGVLSGGKKCIGQRDDWICSKEFVANRLQNGKDVSETEYHPSAKNPVFGCTQCLFAMCAPCRYYYDENDRKSPKKRRGKLVVPV